MFNCAKLKFSHFLSEGGANFVVFLIPTFQGLRIQRLKCEPRCGSTCPTLAFQITPTVWSLYIALILSLTSTNVSKQMLHWQEIFIASTNLCNICSCVLSPFNILPAIDPSAKRKIFVRCLKRFEQTIALTLDGQPYRQSEYSAIFFSAFSQTAQLSRKTPHFPLIPKTRYRRIVSVLNTWSCRGSLFGPEFRRFHTRDIFSLWENSF